MKLKSSSFSDNSPIPGHCAFCVPDPEEHVALGRNQNPALSWEEVPQGTRSFVLICHDSDVPSKPDDVNKESQLVPPELRRVDFYHWVLVDLPADAVAIEVGEFSEGVTPKGKAGPAAPRGARQGVNSYTEWFANDPDMAGDYFGYDGPCPPWNDSIVHHYHFTLYALDSEGCPVGEKFTAVDVLKAIEGHVLAQAKLTGTYSLNPDVRA
jgi:Raf kinase inhibitor-like YbhB/YbcL family protein